MEEIYYNEEAECAVIGLAMAFPETVAKVAELQAEELYYPQNQIALSAVKALAEEKRGIDLITMTAKLKEGGKLEEAGGAGYLTRCLGLAVSAVMLKDYLKIIRDCHSRRVQRRIAREYSQKLDAGENVEEIREWVLRTMKEVKEARETGIMPLKDAAMLTYNALDEDQKREDQPTKRILSGISTMDNKLGGLRGSEYVAIGARPSVGKSIFALTYCLNAAKQGKRVLLVSLEMDEIQITERIFASQSGATLNEITSGEISEQGWTEIAGALGRVSGLPLWYSTTANTVEKVRRCAYELFEGGGIDMIAIDYIQLMEAGGNNGRMNRQEEIARISRGLRQMAAELKIPILVLTQLNRTSAKGQMIKGKKVRTEPTMSEARESGAIEQDANIFMLLHDPDESEMRNEEEKEVYKALKAQGYQMMRIIIDKNRQGKRGRVTLAFDGDHMRFLPIVRGVEAPY